MPEPDFGSDRLAPALDAMVRDDGWTTCPQCKGRFAIYDDIAWDGARHRCGAELTLAGSPQVLRRGLRQTIETPVPSRFSAVWRFAAAGLLFLISAAIFVTP